MITKKYTHTFFGEQCKNCSNRMRCVSPSSILGDDRRYLLKLMGYKQKPNEAMLKGTENHDKRQEGLLTVTDLGKFGFQARLLDGQELILKEVAVCSPVLGFRGFIDILKIRYDKERQTINFNVIELKSGHNFKSYMMQLACYGMILSDPNCFVYYEEPYKRKEKKPKLVPFKLYRDKDWITNIDCWLEIFGEKEVKWIPFMSNNHTDDKMKGFSLGFRSKVKHKRKFHEPGIYYLEHTKPCHWCKQDMKNCDLLRICKTIEFIPQSKHKQMYFGKNKLVVGSKPKKV